MSQVLSVSLRPRNLSQMIGQKTLVEALCKQMAERVPQSIMLIGPSGNGKTSLARIIATAVQCAHQKLWGEPCEACSQPKPGEEYKAWWDRMKSQYTIHEVNAAKDNGVEEIGHVIDVANFAPMIGRYRVIIMDECQLISKQAQGTLLKPTEEPAATTLWIFCTTDPQKLLPTIQRRFVQYTLKGLGANGTEMLLQRAAKEAKFTKPLEPLVTQLARHGVTSSGSILMAMEKFVSGFSAEECVVTGETSAETLSICKAMISADYQSLKVLLQKVSPEESRLLRASTVGYLKGCFWREMNPKKCDAIALSLQELMDGRAPLSDNELLPWLIGGLYRVTRRLGIQ